MSQFSIKEQITDLCRTLHLPTIHGRYDELIAETVRSSPAYDEFLLDVLRTEEAHRQHQRIKQRIKTAGFPQQKCIEDLSIADLPDGGRQHLKTLCMLDFIGQGRNVILSGNPGTGKTHIAIGIGIKACLSDFKVLFTTVPRLITMLKESRSEHTLRQVENRFEKYDLVICDEFGYISFDKEGAELLFTHLSLRVGKKSTLITTNLSFDRWTELFGDPVLTAAMVDRLTHKAILVNMNGSSYRIKETRKMSG
jgi:DNA replication protein DnaC